MIKIKDNLIREDIVNENGVKIGEIKFNPNDSTIMKSLAEILSELQLSINELDEFKDIDVTRLSNNSTVEEFEAAGKEIEKLNSVFKIEYEVVESCITKLENIFGKETIECFTQGTKDIESLMPLLEYVIPFVQKNRNAKVDKYLESTNSDVME